MMRRRGLRSAAILLAAFAFGPSARGADEWLGKKVIPRPGVIPEAETGVKVRDKSDWFEVFRVERVDGRRLLLTAENSPARGWVTADQVIPFEHAVEQLTALIAAGSPTADAYLWRGYLHRLRNELDQAIADYDAAIRLEPADAVARRFRGVARYANGDYDAARADYTEAIRIDPTNPRPYRRRGDARFARRELDRAIEDYDAAIRLDPTDAITIANRGIARLELGQYDRAVVDLNEAIRLDPKLATAYVRRGMARTNLQQFDRAIADLDAAIRLDPKPAYFLARALSARALLWAASPAAKDRDATRALDAARSAVELSGNQDVEAFEALAAALAESGDFSHAEDAQRRAVSFAAGPGTKADRFEALVDRVNRYAAGKPYRLPTEKK